MTKRLPKPKCPHLRVAHFHCVDCLETVSRPFSGERIKELVEIKLFFEDLDQRLEEEFEELSSVKYLFKKNYGSTISKQEFQESVAKSINRGLEQTVGTSTDRIRRVELNIEIIFG